MPNKSTAKSSGDRYTSLTNKPASKVSQATIDKIKAMGMTKALASAKSAKPEMIEGLRRMYGANRVATALKAPSSSPVFKGPRNQGKAGATAGMGRASSAPSTKSATSTKSSSVGLPGVTRGATSKPKSTTTSASVTDRRKAAAAAVKRAGGRSM